MAAVREGGFARPARPPQWLLLRELGESTVYASSSSGSVATFAGSAGKFGPFAGISPIRPQAFPDGVVASRRGLWTFDGLSARIVSEGKRIGQRPDSKSGAPQGVVGSNPMPSAVTWLTWAVKALVTPTSFARHLLPGDAFVAAFCPID